MSACSKPALRRAWEEPVSEHNRKAKIISKLLGKSAKLNSHLGRFAVVGNLLDVVDHSHVVPHLSGRSEGSERE